MSESSNSEFQPEEGGLQSFRSEAIPEQVPQGGLRGLINRARQKFTRGHSKPPPESTPQPDPTDLLDQTRIQNYDGEELRAALRQRGETERASSFSERLRKSWEGLIFSGAEELAEKVGVDLKVANALTDTHLMDRNSIRGKLFHAGLQKDEVDKVENTIFDYREKNGLVIKIPEYAGDLDITNISAIHKAGMILDLVTKNLIREKIQGDIESYEAFMREEHTQGTNWPVLEGEEREGKSWNVPLAEAGASFIQQLRDKIPSLGMSPETKRRISEFIKNAGPNLKEYVKKNWRELGMITARGLVDIFPELRYAIALSASGALATKEIATYTKGWKELKKSGQKANLWTASLAYASQTTMVKLGLEESETGLSDKAKLGSFIVGAFSSFAGIVGSEVASSVVRVPVGRRYAATAVARAFSQHLAPWALDVLASKAGKFESEEQRKEWVTKARKVSGFYNTTLATLFMWGQIAELSQHPEIMLESARSAIDTTAELAENVKDSLEGVDLEKASETIEGKIVEQGPVGVITGTIEAIQKGELQPTEAGVEGPAETQPGAPVEAAAPEAPEAAEPGVPAPEAPTVPETPLEPSWLFNAIDSDGDGQADLFQFDTDNDGNPDASTKFGEDGEPIEVKMSDNTNLLIDPNSKGIPGLQYHLTVLHGNEWSGDEIATAATRAYSEGVHGDNFAEMANIQKPEFPAILGEVNEQITQYINDGKEYDDQGRVVGGTTSEGQHLAFAVEGKGVQHLQFEIANANQNLSPDQVAKMAQIAFVQKIDPDNTGEVGTFVRTFDLSKIEAPPPPPEAVSKVEIPGGTWGLDKDGNVVEATLPDGRHLSFEGTGVQPYQEAFADLREQGGPGEEDNLTPLQVSKLAQRAYEQGLANPDKVVDLKNPDALQNFIDQNLEAVTAPPVLGERVPENDIIFPDNNNDGEPDGTWYRDKDNNIVGGRTSEDENLAFYTTGEGVGRFQWELAKLHPDWTPDEVAEAAQRAVSDKIGLNKLGLIEKPVIEVPQEPLVLQIQDKLQELHPDWTEEELQRAAYLESLKGTSPDDTDTLKAVEVPYIPVEEEVRIEGLVKGQEFDTDGDGKTDSWWLTDPKSGEVEAGHLSDGKTLVLGPDGGQNGILNDYLAHENPNLSPDEVANIASNTVSENDLKPPQEVEGEATFDKIVGEGERPAVIETMNQRIAQLSLEDYLEDIGLGKDQAYNAVRQIQFEPLGRTAIPNTPIGPEALNSLNARVNIPEKGIFSWTIAPWNDWLKEKGMLN